MPLRWHLFRVSAILHLLAGLLLSLVFLVEFLNYERFWNFIYLLVGVVIVFLGGFSLTTLRRHYPEEPIQGSVRKTYNRLFLLSVLMLIFLFSLFFENLRAIRGASLLLGRSWLELPWQFWSALLFSSFLLINHFLVLWGLFALRRELLINFAAKKFEFE